MKLIFVKEEFYLISQEDFNEGDYYCIFATGIKGSGRGWSEPKKHENRNLDRLHKLIHENHKGKVIASSVKIGDLPLIDYKQIIHGENFVPYVKNLSNEITIEAISLEYAKTQIVEGKNIKEWDDELVKIISRNFKAGYEKSNRDNYENKFTLKDIEEAFTYGYLAAKDETKGIPSSGYMTRFLESKNKEKNEWNIEVELDKNGQLKTKEGYVNILKIKIN